MRHTKSEAGRLVELGRQERAVLRQLLPGRENKEIAHALGISEGTVKVYLTHVAAGLNLHTRGELVAWALSHPLALAGYAVSRDPHPDGCACGSPYCSALRLIDEAA